MPNLPFNRIPLAWLQLSRQKSRFLVAIAGIAFADLLIFVQMGFEGALYDSAKAPYKNLNADLMIANPQFQTLFAVRSSPRERLYQTLQHPEVASVTPIYIASSQWQNPETKQPRTILIWGSDPGAQAFNLPEVNQQRSQLQQLDRILFDRAGRPEYGDIAAQFEKNGFVNAQVNSAQVQVAGLFAIGSSFAADGNAITSDSTFMRIHPDRTPDKMEAGLIKLKPGADVEKVKASIAATLPNDVRVLTPLEWAAIEEAYWANGTGIGFIFGIGVAMGFFVGIIIVYQILHSDVTDHLPEYATLKAMGYTNFYLITMILQESLILACCGFIPSYLLATAVYNFTYSATLLPIAMTQARAITVFMMTVIMCSISGTIAMRKLQKADPADVF
jgi:putative ABC transport system permease protein